MRAFDMQPGVSAMGHVAGGFWHPGPADNCRKGPCWARNSHDYSPGEITHPMHTDPLCVICGLPKRSSQHR